MKHLIGLFISLLAIASPGFAVNHCQPTKAAPDLVVTDVKVDASCLEKDQTVKVKYTVKNQGKATAKRSTAATTIYDKSGKALQKSVKQDIPSLPPSQSYTAEISYPVRTRGNFLIKATADYQNKLTEGSDLNNSNTLRFSIGFGR